MTRQAGIAQNIAEYEMYLEQDGIRDCLTFACPAQTTIHHFGGEIPICPEMSD
jgi:hypothetical protein